MIRILCILLCSPIFMWNSYAQSARTADYLEGTFSFAKHQGALSAQYAHVWMIGKSKKLAIGLGGRVTSYLGANQYYVTAPARLTSGSTSPLIFFKENNVENMDTLLVKSPQVTLLNLNIHILYQFSSRFAAGFNIDAIGFSFGGNQSANYINGITGKNTNGRPTAFNVLLISDNDRGSLNSELFAKYRVHNQWSIKAGMQFLFTEYTTETEVQQYPSPNDRFRRKSLLLGLGVSYQIR